MLRKLAILLGFIIFFTSIIPIQEIEAEELIEINIEPGYEGSVKPAQPFPLQITVNNKGEDFVGELTIKFAPSQYAGGDIVIPINIPQETQKRWTVFHPGIHPDFSFNFSQNTVVQLFEGSIENGKKVDFSGDKSISVRLLQGEQFVISVVSDNPEILNSYRAGQFNYLNPHVFQLKEDEFPNNPFTLSMIDLIVLDNAHIDEWSEEQQNALLKFIKLGGSILISNSTEQFSHLGILKSYVPFQESNQVEGTGLQFLSKEDEPAVTTELYEGPNKDGANLLVEDQQLPILVQNTVALGEIYQVSFQLDANEIIQHPGYGQWLADQLDNSIISQSTRYHPGMDPLAENYHSIGNTGELFEKGNLSFPVISMIIAIYVLLLLPSIYFILRKIDKREHAWWIIPSVSVVFSIIIFFVGAYDRIGKPTFNELGVYVLDEDEGAVGYSSNSLLSNKQGEFSITYSEPDFSPIPIYQDFDNEVDKIDGNAYIQLDSPKKEIRYPTIDFWSTKTALGSIYKENVGDLTADLSYKNGKLSGTIANHLNVSIKDLWFAVGTEMISLGNVDSNSTINVDEFLNTSIISKPTFSSLINHNNNIQPYRNQPYEELSTLKKNRLFDFFGGHYLEKLPDQPLLLAISEEPFINSQVKGGSTRIAMNLFAKPIELDAEISGAFELSKDNMLLEFSPLNPSNSFIKMEVTDHEAYVGIGEYQLSYQLPVSIRNTSYELKEATINIYREQGIEVYLYNVSDGDYEKIDATQNSINFSSEIKNYINEQGILKFKFVKSDDFGNVIIFPGIVLKGDIQ